MEKAFWFGKRFEGTRNGRPIRTMGGVFEWIDSGNIVDQAGAATDMEQLEEWLFEAFSFGSNEKVAMVGNRALLTINQIVRKNTDLTIQSGIREFGMNVTRLTCPFGELVMKTHPLWNQYGGSSGNWQGVDSWMAILDMNELKYVNLRDSDTKYQKVLQTNDLDGMKSGYLTECSLEMHHPKTHYLIKGLTNPAVDS
jgi:hypothetical protein